MEAFGKQAQILKEHIRVLRFRQHHRCLHHIFAMIPENTGPKVPIDLYKELPLIKASLFWTKQSEIFNNEYKIHSEPASQTPQQCPLHAHIRKIQPYPVHRPRRNIR